jgi:hypothetical protein
MMDHADAERAVLNTLECVVGISREITADTGQK